MRADASTLFCCLTLHPRNNSHIAIKYLVIALSAFYMLAFTIFTLTVCCLTFLFITMLYLDAATPPLNNIHIAIRWRG